MRAKAASLAEQVRREIAACDARLRQHRAALEAGAEPKIVAGWMNETQAQRSEAQARLRPEGQRRQLTADQIAVRLAELGVMSRLRWQLPGLKARRSSTGISDSR